MEVTRIFGPPLPLIPVVTPPSWFCFLAQLQDDELFRMLMDYRPEPVLPTVASPTMQSLDCFYEHADPAVYGMDANPSDTLTARGEGVGRGKWEVVPVPASHGGAGVKGRHSSTRARMDKPLSPRGRAATQSRPIGAQGLPPPIRGGGPSNFPLFAPFPFPRAGGGMEDAGFAEHIDTAEERRLKR